MYTRNGTAVRVHHVEDVTDQGPTKEGTHVDWLVSDPTIPEVRVEQPRHRDFNHMAHHSSTFAIKHRCFPSTSTEKLFHSLQSSVRPLLFCNLDTIEVFLRKSKVLFDLPGKRTYTSSLETYHPISVLFWILENEGNNNSYPFCSGGVIGGDNFSFRTFCNFSVADNADMLGSFVWWSL